jgi:L-iditol 2-dehydrogenase
MKAAVLYGREDVRIEQVKPRPLESGEVRIEIGAALTCGTDLKVFKRGYHARMIVPPAVFGHELAGTISEIAPGADDWKVGDRVAAANSAPCGDCFSCRNNQENLCDDLLFLNGAYAESIVVPERLVRKNLLRLQAETAFEDAALTEPLACVAQGIEEARVRSGQRILVLGAGPIGLMFVALAKQLGGEVSVAGRGAARLELAARLGAGTVMDAAGQDDLAQCVRESTGAGFDVVIEAVGKPEVWEIAPLLVRKGGVVNFFGGCPAGTRASFDTNLMHYSNLTFLSSFHHTPRSIRRALEFIESGVVRSRHFVNGECALSGLPELFRSMAAGNRAVKTFIRVKE